MNKQDEIRVMKHFINAHTLDEIAEFIVNLNNSLSGLQENHNLFVKEYRKLLSTSHNTDYSQYKVPKPKTYEVSR